MSSVEPPQGRKLLTVRIDQTRHEWVKQYAKEHDTTVSQLVRDFLKHLQEEATVEKVERF